MRGENTGRVYRLGDKVKVQVIKVDMERRQVDLGLSEILDRIRESERNRGPRRSRIEPGRQPRANAPTKKAEAGLPRGRDGVAKAGKRRTQRPGRKERSAKRGKPR